MVQWGLWWGGGVVIGWDPVIKTDPENWATKSSGDFHTYPQLSFQPLQVVICRCSTLVAQQLGYSFTKDTEAKKCLLAHQNGDGHVRGGALKLTLISTRWVIPRLASQSCTERQTVNPRGLSSSWGGNIRPGFQAVKEKHSHWDICHRCTCQRCRLSLQDQPWSQKCFQSSSRETVNPKP